jgi:hypothetical protein
VFLRSDGISEKYKCRRHFVNEKEIDCIIYSGDLRVKLR